MHDVGDHADLVQRIKGDDALHGRGHEQSIHVAALETEIVLKIAGQRVDVGKDAAAVILDAEVLHHIDVFIDARAFFQVFITIQVVN